MTRATAVATYSLSKWIWQGQADMAETVVDIQDAQSRLPELIEQAAAGEAIIIAKGGKPLARLMPPSAAARPRQPGGWEGKVWVSEDFDDPLPPDILRHFTNGGSP